MQEKTHYKLHKVKKHWVTIAATVSTGLAMAVAGSVAQADQITDQQVDALPQDNTVTEVSDSKAALTAQASTDQALVANQEPAVAQSATATTESDQTEGPVDFQVSEETLILQSSEAPAPQADLASEAPAPVTNVTAKDSASVSELSQAPVNTFYHKDDTDQWFYADQEGNNVTGHQTINGQELYFNEDGSQVKGQMVVEPGETITYHPIFQSNESTTQVNQLYYFDPDSGDMWKNRFVYTSYKDENEQEHEGWFYLGSDGRALIGWQEIDGKHYYFDIDGTQVKGKLISTDGKYASYYQEQGQKSYLDPNSGEALTNQFVNAEYRLVTFAGSSRGSGWFYMGADGIGLTGWQEIDGNLYYFDENGFQVKGNQAERDGKFYFLDADSGKIVTNSFQSTPARIVSSVEAIYPKRYYYTEDGSRFEETGWQVIDGQTYYFKDDHSIMAQDDPNLPRLATSRPSDGFATIDGKLYHFDTQGHLTVNGFAEKFTYAPPGQWYYMGADGTPVTGLQEIYGHVYYFDEDGTQVKGQVRTIDGQSYYFDTYSGEKVVNTRIYYDDVWYDIDAEGHLIQSVQKPIIDESNPANTLTNGHYEERDGYWVYVTEEGTLAKGLQVIDGQKVYFDADGHQAKGDRVYLDGDTYYFDQDSGELWTNRFLEVAVPNSQDDQTAWIYFDATGRMVTGWQTIDGKRLYFLEPNRALSETDGGFTGMQVKGLRQVILDGDDAHEYYFDEYSGELVTNQEFMENGVIYQSDSQGHVTRKPYGDTLTDDNPADTVTGGQFVEREFFDGQYSAYYKGWVYEDANGNIVKGLQVIGGKKYYFNTSTGIQAKGAFVRLDDNTYYFDREDGSMVTNQTITIDRSNARNYFGYYPSYNGWIHLGANGQADSGRFQSVGSPYTYSQKADGTGAWFNSAGEEVIF